MDTRKKGKKIIRFLLLLFLVAFFLLPRKSEVSMGLFYFCFGIFVYTSYIYFKSKHKINYFDFDTLFVVLYGLCMFVTTFLYNNEVLYKALFLGYIFDTQYVNSGNILSTIGILSYYYGGLCCFYSRENNTACRKSIIPTSGLCLTLAILVALFFVSGGVAYSKAAYQDGVGSYSSIITYVLLLITYSSIVIIASEYYNKRHFPDYHIKKQTFYLVSLIVAILLLGGSRSDASYIVIPIIALFAHFFRPIKKTEMFIFFFLGIVFMWFIGQIRSGEGIDSVSNPVLYLIDLTVPSRNTYAVFEYIDHNGYTYGSSFVGLFSCIPFLSNLLSLTNGSSELLTQDFYANNPQYDLIGLGTTVVADIYIAFGVFGVILIMYIIGKYASKIQFFAAKSDYYYIVAYAALMSISIFIVRGYCTIPLRPILWSWAIAYINVKIHKIEIR